MLVGLIFQVVAVCFVSADNNCQGENPYFMQVYPKTTSFTIECGVHFSPPPSDSTYTWEKNIGNGWYPITSDSLTEIFNASLRFLNYDTDQDGYYLCASRNNNTTHFMQLYLLQKLRIVPDASNFQIDTIDSPEFQYLKINCSFHGEVVGDDIEYNWVRRTNTFEQLSSESDRVYPDLRGNLHFTPVLAIDEALDKASMPYLCFVMSPKLFLGRYGRHVLLTVSAGGEEPSAPILKHKTNNLRAVINKNTQLECVFYGYDPNSPTANRWYLPNGSLVPTESTKYQLLYGGRRLVIARVQLSDAGVYHCESENGLGVSSREPVRLQVCAL